MNDMIVFYVVQCDLNILKGKVVEGSYWSISNHMIINICPIPHYICHIPHLRQAETSNSATKFTLQSNINLDTTRKLQRFKSQEGESPV